MSKGEAILKIEPEHELRFRGPFKEPVSVVMKLTNTAEKKACFKVKTTAPKRYCVKPTTGTIDPKGTVTILVTLQPFDPNDPNEKGKHKFQVLSAIAPDFDFNIETLWKDATLEINDWKLKCVLETPEEQPAAAAPAAAPAAPITSSVSAPLASVPPAPIIKEDKAVKDGSSQRINALEAEVKQASDEIKRLREEISTLTRENINLKEENVRQRRNIPTTTAEKQEQPAPAYRPRGQDTVAQPNFLYIIVALLLGIILAKLFF